MYKINYTSKCMILSVQSHFEQMAFHHPEKLTQTVVYHTFPKMYSNVPCVHY